jgi:hypothetical protein
MWPFVRVRAETWPKSLCSPQAVAAALVVDAFVKYRPANTAAETVAAAATTRGQCFIGDDSIPLQSRELGVRLRP